MSAANGKTLRRDPVTPAPAPVLRVLAAIDDSARTGRLMNIVPALDAARGPVEVVLLGVQPKPQEWWLRGYGGCQRETIKDRLINDLGRWAVMSAARHLDSAGIVPCDRIEIGAPAEAFRAAPVRRTATGAHRPVPSSGKGLLPQVPATHPNTASCSVIHSSAPPNGKGAAMSEIADYLRTETVFEPEEINALSAAFEKACAILRFENRSHSLKQALATLIIEHARRGEFDPHCLCDATLERIAGYRSPEPGPGRGRNSSD